MYRNILCNICLKCDKKLFSTTPALNLFWERDDKGGYKDNRTPPTLKERMRVGIRELKKEIILWRQEVKERFEMDNFMIFRPGEVDVFWKFGGAESLNKWVVTTDSDHNEGYSKCSLQLNEQGNACFSGNTCLRVPKDGRVKRAGYCNMRTTRARKSFKRDSYFNWVNYNMLVMRVRGDGRSYMINLSTKGYYDMMWNDIYHYVLFTRGGPYWQVARIPFSKFFLGSKGRIQDRQSPVPLDRISHFGITAADRYGGDFSLEIDYIGLEFDPNHTEEFAYEMYNLPRFIAGY